MDGLWDVPLVYRGLGQWLELGSLRFDGLGRLRPTAWAHLYERIAAAMSADPVVRSLAGIRGDDGLTADEALHLVPDRDPVTGLPALGLWHARARREMARSSRYGDLFSAALLRVEDLLRLDESLGPRLTDAVCRICAERLLAAVGDENLLCAAGRGNFGAVIVEDGSPAWVRLSRLVGAVKRRPVPLDRAGDAVTVVVNAGGAVVEPGQGVGDLLRRAGQALERAEAEGGGRVTMAAPTDLSNGSKAVRRDRAA